ncbi:MAG: hypothetical protein ACLU37_04590 [Collinsella sp.]
MGNGGVCHAAGIDRQRCKREHANRKGRSMEIERLIGRSHAPSST